MASQDTLNQSYRFGDFTFDLRKGLLLKAGQPLVLRPKSHSLLQHLAANLGRVVPKAELMDAVSAKS